MITQRWAVVAINPLVPAGERVFGPMSLASAIEFEAGLKDRYPQLRVTRRPQWKPTYATAADILAAIL